MPVLLGHIDRSLQHENAERDAWDPGDEAKDVKHTEQQEHNSSRPVSAIKHVGRCCESENDIKYAGYPDELLCEGSGSPHVRIAENRGHTKDERE